VGRIEEDEEAIIRAEIEPLLQAARENRGIDYSDGDADADKLPPDMPGPALLACARRTAEGMRNELVIEINGRTFSDPGHLRIIKILANEMQPR